MQNIQKNAGKLSCSFHKIMKMKKKYTDSYRLFVLKSNRKENQEKMFEVGEYIVYGLSLIHISLLLMQSGSLHMKRRM